MKHFEWSITVMANTMTPDLRKHRIHRIVEGVGDAEKAMLRVILAQRKPAIWLGCEITGLTDTGQVIKRIFECENREYYLLRQ